MLGDPGSKMDGFHSGNADDPPAASGCHVPLRQCNRKFVGALVTRCKHVGDTVERGLGCLVTPDQKWMASTRGTPTTRQRPAAATSHCDNAIENSSEHSSHAASM